MTRWSGFDAAGNNAMKIGLDWSVPSVNNGTTSITINFTASTGNRYQYNDNNQTIIWSNDITGTDTYNNTQGAGSETVRASRSVTYNYPSGSYGSSPGSVTVKVRVGYSYNGSHPELTVTVAIPARPYAKPNAPSNVVESRVSDTKTNLSWTRNATSGKPYSTLTIQRQDTANVWKTVATISGSATSWQDSGVTSNQAYKYQVRANNSAGSSGWVASGWIYTTPSAPTSVKAALQSNGSIKVTWASSVRYDQHTYDIDRLNGSTWQAAVVGLSYTARSWTDPSPLAGANQYRVKSSHWESGNPSQQLISSPTNSNTVSTIVPPLAPTNLKPNGVIVDPIASGGTVAVTWQHNPGGDGADQTKLQLRKSNDNGATWGTTSIYDSPTSAYNLGVWTNGLSYIWQVRTWGAHADPSPWSASATIVTSTTPTVTIDEVGDAGIVTTMPTTISWEFNQDEGLTQAGWEARLYDEVAPDDVLATGSGTTQTSWTITYPLQDGHAYFVRVRGRANTLWSNWAEQYFLVDLLPPANVAISPSFDPESGVMVLDLHADDPSPDGTLLRTNLATTPRPNPTWTSYPAADDDSDPVGGTVTYVTAEIPTAPTITTAWHVEGAGGAAGIYPMGSAGLTLPTTGPVSVSFWVRSSVAATALIQADGVTVTSQTAVFSDWTLISGTAPSASSVIAAAFTASTGWVEATGVMVEQTATVGSYFDGATPDDGSLGNYEWSGTSFSSTSTLTSPGTNAIDHVAIQRRIDGGEWITIIDNVTFPDGPDQTVLDTTPSLKGVMEYRLIVTSVSPSTLVTEPVQYETHGWQSTLWGFLSYGAGFSQIVRAAGNPELDDAPERARATQPAAGRKYPILLVGEQRSRVRSVSLLTWWDDTIGSIGVGSTDHEWAEASLEADIACWRDWRGGRYFGRIDGMKIKPNRGDKTADISFSIEQVDYREGV